MRVVFFGTPRFAVPSLLALHQDNHEVLMVVTQPDRPSGRGREILPGAVKQEAKALRFEICQPQSLTHEFSAAVAARTPDVIVVVAYGLILPRTLLDVPHRGCINVHASLLPKYRGAAPVHHAILRGETVTGVSTVRMDEGIDSGSILLQREVVIGEQETTGELEERLAEEGARLLVQTLEGLERNTVIPRPQEGELATYAPRIRPEAARVDWSRPASSLFNFVRAMNPRPGAFTRHRGRLVKIWRVSRPSEWMPIESEVVPGTIVSDSSRLRVVCGAEETLEIHEVQLEGRRRISGEEAIRGRWFVGRERLGP